MRYATATAFRRALEQRLLAMAREANIPVMRLRKLVTFDRLMARLLIVAPDRWVLKGALALELRFATKSRTTRDMDLGRHDNEEAATADLLAAQSIELHDHFHFAVTRTGRLDALEGAAVRYHVAAELAGRPFEDVIVDVGLGDPEIAPPDLLPGPDLLGFAGIPRIAVPAVPLEQHMAEKVHAYTRVYGDQRPSTRVKDLIDLVLIADSTAFEAARVRHALGAVFASRGTHPLPAALPPPPANWGTAYRKMALEVGLDPNVVIGHRLAAAFLDPILDGAVSDDGRWDPLRGGWSPVGTR